MAKWRIAESLLQLRKQLNAAYPQRSKLSDGGIGDSSHAARSDASDHNPHVMDGTMGIVTAIDITADPAHGCDAAKLAQAWIESRDDRIKYIIYNKRMVSSYPSGGKPAWTWRPYSGANPHQKHIHISVVANKSLYDSTDDWTLPADADAPPLEDAPILNGEASKPEPLLAEAAPQQTVEAGGVGVIAGATEPQREPISKPGDKPIDVVAVEPQTTDKRRTIWATILAGVAWIGLNIKEFFTNAYAVSKDNPLAIVALVCGSLVILAIYWRYTENENRKKERRSQQAHELTLEQMRLAADPDRYSVSVVKADPPEPPK